ncbi:MAG: hypothetical protein HFH45_01240 [Bacilli bacterium]|nr:hypothetical protein [Bacilli bacterium]
MSKERLGIVLVITIVISFLYLIISFMYDFYKDYQCGTMPFDEMKLDSSCAKYWKDKVGSNG